MRVDRCPKCLTTLRERTTEKNARFHAVMGELSAQLDWPRGSGKYLDIEAWKRLIVSAYERAHGRSADIYPALDGHGFDVVYRRTSRMSQQEMRDLIDFAESWAIENGVRLKELDAAGSAMAYTWAQQQAAGTATVVGMLLQRDPPVDWKAVLLDFVRWGWKLRHVADAINVPHSTLMRWWLDGSQPTYENGRALLKLHEYAKKRFSDPGERSPGLQPAR